jgi:sigma-B regulation protein RsbU (phosphoserine phosphatase)
MSLCYGVFDAVGRTFTYTNAGHPAPLLFREGEVQTLESHGLILGVVPEAGYQQSVVELQSGDLLVLYSDGISEARSSDQELFKAEGLVACVLAGPRESAGTVLDSIWSRVDEFIIGGEAGDDRTVLVLRVN